MTSQMPNQHLPVSTVDVDDDDNVGYDMLVSAEVAAAGRMGLAQGHRCCGRNGSGCCDMRRAVIIVNLVDIAICLFYAIYFALMAEAVEEIPDSTYGGETKAQMEGMMLKMEHIFIILSAIKIPLNGLGIYGAVKFKYWPVAVALGAYSIQFLLHGFAINIGGLLLSGFFAYPHVFFLKEVRSGVMSEMNYPTERFSCCCV